MHSYTTELILILITVEDIPVLTPSLTQIMVKYYAPTPSIVHPDILNTLSLIIFCITE